jgi:serine/threonine protein kinase
MTIGEGGVQGLIKTEGCGAGQLQSSISPWCPPRLLYCCFQDTVSIIAGTPVFMAPEVFMGRCVQQYRGCQESAFQYCSLWGFARRARPSLRLSLFRRGCLSSDWFSLGVLTFRCLAGRLPFDGLSRQVVQGNVMRNAVRWDSLPPHVSASARDFLRALLQPDPALRLGTAGGWREVLAHPFFQVGRLYL